MPHVGGKLGGQPRDGGGLVTDWPKLHKRDDSRVRAWPGGA